MIKFDSVSKKYKDQVVLKNISFSIDKGQVVAVIGASGCGKTTTLKMINRLIKPTSGKIFINNQDISLKNVIALRRNMGYVIQQVGLFPHMTVEENIEIISAMEKRELSTLKKRTCELMEMVGLDVADYLHRYPVELSGGQQQRVGVARAFATDPEIVLMDEPFSALDPITRSQLQDELINLQAQIKKTIVFVTHDMDEAVKIADKICIMDSGEILQYDTPEVILKNPCNDFVSEFVGKNRIWTSPEFIKARDIMIDRPVTSLPEVSLLKCLEKMRLHNVDSLMITDKTNTLLGILKAVYIKPQINMNLPASQIMRTDFLRVSPEDTIVDVLTIVDKNNVANIPVIEKRNKLAGLITQSSLVTTLSQQFIETRGA